ncbi:MAG: patatin-like phospholipase family protein [Burkholderiaceae bacterium]
MTATRSPRHPRARPPAAVTADSEETILVLQGGGALGAYQGGVFEALSAVHHEPTWVAGISIGAINAALIAGNPPADRTARLREFWDLVSSALPTPPIVAGARAREALNEISATQVMQFGVPGFFQPRFPPAPFQPIGTLEAISFYDTTPLKQTLERLIDFDRINAGPMRLSVGAVNVRTGNFAYFDSAKQRIDVRHIMASGALPPGFAPVEIDGEHFWDGGLVSNTPLQYVLDQPGQAPPGRFPGRSVRGGRCTPHHAARGERAREGHPLFQPHPAHHRPYEARPAGDRAGRATAAREAATRIAPRPRCARPVARALRTRGRRWCT